MARPIATSAQQLIDSIATVNTRLFAQLLEQGRPEAELQSIRQAYELTAELYSAAYQADGRPFTAHVVSVASILALIGMPSNIVAAGLVHNVYGNGDFGDGRHSGVTPERRRRVREAVGDDVEDCVHRFRELRLTDDLAPLKARIGSLSERDRMIVAIEFADLLDKYADLSVLYFGDGRWVTRYVDANESDLLEIGYALNQPVLTDALRCSIARVRSHSVPDALRSPADRKYLYTVVPPSLTERPRLKWQRVVKRSAPWRLVRRVIRGPSA